MPTADSWSKTDVEGPTTMICPLAQAESDIDVDALGKDVGYHRSEKTRRASIFGPLVLVTRG